MFKKNDCVVHKREGVCLITGIESYDLGNGVMEYYVLKPYYSTEQSIIKIPVNNASQIREHISKDSAKKLVKNINKSEDIWINDNRKRKDLFQKIIAESDPAKLACIVRSVYLKKAEYSKIKKSLPLTDQNMAEFCERLLHEELAIALNIEFSEVNNYIEKNSK